VGIQADGARVLRPDLDDALDLYAHYRDNTGTPVVLDYAEAYSEDDGIRRAVDGEIADVARAVDDFAQHQDSFAVTSRQYTAVNEAAGTYPTTENWQKSLGGHNIWSSADVEVVGDEVRMHVTVHAEDRYDFNEDAADIASGAPDDENGRFSTLGWAQGFETSGAVTRYITWRLGDPVGEVPPGEGSEDRDHTGGSDPRGPADDRNGSRSDDPQ